MQGKLLDLFIDELKLGIADDITYEKMDTCSAYFGRRFCSSCCKEWGDMDVLLDLIATRTGVERTAAMRKLRSDNVVKHVACCNRALFPVQHNIASVTCHAVHLLNSSVPLGIPSSLALSASRERYRNVVHKNQKPIPIRDLTSLDQVIANESQ
jgi:hypothetical protein